MPDPDREPATGPPRRGRPGYGREAVLRRAIALFNAQGYDATSMADLGRDLGLSKSAVYHHFPGKETLLSAALDEALDGLSAAVDSALDSTVQASALQRLRRALEQSVLILVDHLPAVTLLLRVRGNSQIEIAALARRRVIDDKVAGLVRAAVLEGGVREDVDPYLISRLLFGTVNSLAEWYRPGGPVDPGELASTVTTMAFEGLTPRWPENGDHHAAAPSRVDAPGTEAPGPEGQASKSTTTRSPTG